MNRTLIREKSVEITMSPGQTNWPFVINVSNSIIGVTVLAMPFCFKTCGIILGGLLLFFSTWLTMMSCQLLMKAGVTSRRRSYSLLAYYTHGATGKLIVEFGMIGLQLGTLVAQVVIIGDLGPAIVSKFTGLPNTDRLRTGLIVFLCLFVCLPLGLLKDVRTLSKTSAMCILFYVFFTVYVVLLSVPKLVSGSWFSKVVFWRKEGFFQCLPIFSFAFGCQTQLFIVYEALSEPSLKKINSIVSSAVHLCTAAYLLVGFFGYIAFCDVTDLSGDIINHFGENTVSDAIKLCFVCSIAVSIPLIVFPCRASLYTLLFPQKPKEDVPGAYKIPEFHFRVITAFIIVGSMIIGILVPNVEFVLGLNGATMGTLICYIFPALFFLAVMSDTSEGKSSGRLVLVFGLTILIVSTYTTLNTASPAEPMPQPVGIEKDLEKLPTIDDPKVDLAKKEVRDEDFKKDDVKEPPDKKDGEDDERQEPPNPQPPEDKEAKPPEPDKGDAGKSNDVKNMKESDKDVDKKDIEDTQKKETDEDKDKNLKEEEKIKIAEIEEKVRVEAEEKARQEAEEKRREQDKKQEEILEKLEEQKVEQHKIIEEQKQILEELKQHQDQHKEGEAVKQQEDQGIDQPQQFVAQQLFGNAQVGVGQPAAQPQGGQPVLNQQPVNQLQNQQQPQPQQQWVNNELGNQQVQQMGQAQPLAQQQGIPQQQLLNNQAGLINQAGGVVQVQGGQQQINQQQFGVNQQLGGQPGGFAQAQAGQQPMLDNQVGLGNQQVPVGQPLNQQLGGQQVQVNQVGVGNQQAPAGGLQVNLQQVGQQQMQVGVDSQQLPVGQPLNLQGQQQMQVGVDSQQLPAGQPLNLQGQQQQLPNNQAGLKVQQGGNGQGARIVGAADQNVKPIVGNDVADIKPNVGDLNQRMKRDTEEGLIKEGNGRDLKQVETEEFVNEFLGLHVPNVQEEKDQSRQRIENDMSELNNKINKDFEVRKEVFQMEKDVQRKR